MKYLFLLIGLVTITCCSSIKERNSEKVKYEPNTDSIINIGFWRLEFFRSGERILLQSIKKTKDTSELFNSYIDSFSCLMYFNENQSLSYFEVVNSGDSLKSTSYFTDHGKLGVIMFEFRNLKSPGRCFSTFIFFNKRGEVTALYNFIDKIQRDKYFLKIAKHDQNIHAMVMDKLLRCF